jgi:hypothetical protein
VLVDPAGLQVGGEPKHEGIWAGSQIEEPKQEMKARDIGHVIICLDISGSMNELCGVINPRTKELVLNPDTNRPYTKLEHIQVAIKELITNGIPGNTPTTLIAYHTTASIPNGSGNTPLAATTDLNGVYNAIEKLKTQGGTNFYSALELAKNQINARLPFDPETTLLVLVTDGQHNEGPDRNEVRKIARELRDLNTHGLIIGVGNRYEEAFLRELSTDFGPAFVVHTPSPNPTINVFGMFGPTFIKDIRNPDYMSIVGIGFSPGGKFFDILPAIKNAEFRPAKGPNRKPTYKLWTGYQTSAIGIGFVPEDKLDDAFLNLCLRRHATGKMEHKVNIPIIPYANAQAHHERREEAEDVNARLLAFLAQREWDADAFDASVADHPSAFNPSMASVISQMLHSGISRDDLRARGTVADAGMGHSVTVGDYRDSVIPSGITGFVNDFSMVPGHLGLSGDPGGPPPGNSGNPSACHSGEYLGPLSLNPPSSIPPFQAGAVGKYNEANPIKQNLSLRLEYNNDKVTIKPDALDLAKNSLILFGRDKEADVRVKAEKVSRNHCFIQREGDDLILKDMGSVNGTYVNGEKITEYKLQSNDVISIGGIKLKIVINRK